MSDKIFIDAAETPMGRAASTAAKEALLGKRVFVLNCEKAVISGAKKSVVEEQKERRALGGSAMKGPFYSKDTEKIMKRAVRGMLPDFRRGRGKEAWRRIRCFNGIPEEYSKEKLVKIKTHAPVRHITLKELKEKL